jgi:aldehyde dehydrogenase (NAD+)
MVWFNPNDIVLPRGHFIAGKYTLLPGKECISVCRPSDQHPYGEIPLADEADVDTIVTQSYHAFKNSGWATCAPRDRAKILYRWAALIEQTQDELAQLESLGSSRPYHEVLQWDLPYVTDCIRFFAELTDKHGGYIGATQSNRLGMVIHEPFGVIGAITPWNFPMSMAIWKVAPALAAGNAVVLKPSELTPLTSLRLAELAHQAGLPANQFNVVLGDGQTTGSALCAHPLINKVTFTGSTQTGTAIMSLCAQTGPKPTTLELGGKSPQIVFADAKDLKQTAVMVARGITGNAGQVCVSGSRLILEASVVDEFVDTLADYFRQLSPGATWHKQTTLSPIISATQLERIDTIVQQSIAAGSRCLSGGARFEAVSGTFYRPTLLQVDRSDDIAISKEIFGPVLTLQTFESESEAWSLASHETYGLAAGIHTQNIDRAFRGMRQIEAGSVWINRYGRSFDHIIPTGGYKRSGIGKDIGREAFEANLRSKSVLIDFDE